MRLYASALLLISAFGCYAAASLVLSHLQGEPCPTIGPVPACMIVLPGYIFVCLAAIMLILQPILIKANNAAGKSPPKDADSILDIGLVRLFYTGFIIVAGIAIYGVFSELAHRQSCPIGPAGVPQCFISLAMIMLCWLCFYCARKA